MLGKILKDFIMDNKIKILLDYLDEQLKRKISPPVESEIVYGHYKALQDSKRAFIRKLKQYILKNLTF